MYQVFDEFLAIPAWSASHRETDQAFYVALGHVVFDPGFDPKRMAAYFLEKGALHPQTGRLTFETRVRDLTSKAAAIRMFHDLTHKSRSKDAAS